MYIFCKIKLICCTDPCATWGCKFGTVRGHSGLSTSCILKLWILTWCDNSHSSFSFAGTYLMDLKWPSPERRAEEVCLVGFYCFVSIIGFFFPYWVESGDTLLPPPLPPHPFPRSSLTTAFKSCLSRRHNLWISVFWVFVVYDIKPWNAVHCSKNSLIFRLHHESKCIRLVDSFTWTCLTQFRIMCLFYRLKPHLTTGQEIWVLIS